MRRLFCGLRAFDRMYTDMTQSKKSRKLDTNYGKNQVYYDALIEQRNQLAAQIRSLSDASHTSSRQPGEELADVGSDSYMRETDIALMGAEGDHLAAIQDAIERLEAGTFGICEECEKRISKGRLQAKPEANRCIGCQEALEAKMR